VVSDVLASVVVGYGRRSAGRQKATWHDAGARVGGAFDAEDPTYRSTPGPVHSIYWHRRM